MFLLIIILLLFIYQTQLNLKKMKKARMNFPYFCFILFNLKVKILGEIISTLTFSLVLGLSLEAQVLGLGIEAYKSSEMPCPWLEDSIIMFL